MQERDYSDFIETDPSVAEKLEEHFDQEIKKVGDLMKELGSEGILRMFVPKKDAKFKDHK